MDKHTLQFDEFIRSVAISQGEIFTAFLGAGTSITSGIPSAADCIWLWKQMIYHTRSGKSLNGLDYKSDAVKILIQKWLDQQGGYPEQNNSNEYSFYVEQCYPLPSDRSKFFKSICQGKEPSVGYKILVLLHQIQLIHSVWTTNFDELCSRTAIMLNAHPVDVTLDSVSRVLRPQNNQELPIIKLHGDYRFGPLKNTETELQDQDATFRQRFIGYLNDKHLIVLGYSGRDESVMEALQEAYTQSGSGRLYWCGYGHDIPAPVLSLIKAAQANGREAFYISTNGFDNTMLSLGPVCCVNQATAQQTLEVLLKVEDNTSKVTPFSMEVKHLNTILKSNLFRVGFPMEVFQFDYQFPMDNKRWQTLRGITAGKRIVAVPKDKLVWAMGTLTDINAAFEAGIKDKKIQRVPIADLNPHKDSSLYHLLLSSLTRSLAERAQFLTNGKDKIWLDSITSQRRFGDTIFFTHKAIRLALTFDGHHSYLTLSPDFHVTAETDDIEITKSVRQEIGLTYFKEMFNKPFSEYINDWRKMLLDTAKPDFEIEYPYASGTGLSFIIERSPGFAKIMTAGTAHGQTLDSRFTKTLRFQGIKYPEQELVFASRTPGMVQPPHDFHSMRGIMQNRPFDHSLVGSLHESTIRLGVICPKDESTQFAPFISRVQAKQPSGNSNPQYLIDYPGFFEAYGVSLDVPQPGMDYWKMCEEPDLNTGSIRNIALDIRNKIIRQIDVLVGDGIKKVIVICIPDRWLNYTSFNEDNEHFDLHDYIKAYCAQKSIGTQFIQESTSRDGLQCQISWWLSLSYFVKSLRTPWVLDSLEPNTAFAGIGYSVSKKNDDTDIVLGCSHIYNFQGMGLKYRLSKVEEQLVWDRLDRPHLSYKDAYRLGLSIIDLFHSTMDKLPKRVVVHKRNYFMQEEISGLTDSLKQSGIVDIDLIEINFEDDARFVAGVIRVDGTPDVKNFPVDRGTCILLNGREALLWTHGVVPSVKNPTWNYFLGGRFIPSPLRIIKHYGKANIDQVATEILGLTKVNWNSFDLYSTLPATVSSSNEIARIGRLLSKREGGNYDYRYFI